jgi:hypothetical protein
MWKRGKNPEKPRKEASTGGVDGEDGFTQGGKGKKSCPHNAVHICTKFGG